MSISASRILYGKGILALVLLSVTLLLGACGGGETPEAETVAQDYPTLPAPSGPHKVGVINFELSDPTRPELPGGQAPRRIPVMAWYPAAGVSGEPRLYAKPREFEHQIKPMLEWMNFAGEDISERLALYQTMRSNSFEDAPLKDLGKMPTLVFSHGGFAYPQTNTVLMEHLASHGYLVFSISHPGIASATLHDNGDVIPVLTSVRDGMMAGAADPDYLAAFVSEDISTRFEAHLRNIDTHVLSPFFLKWQEDFIFAIDKLAAGELPGNAAKLSAAVDMQRLGTFGMSFGASGSAAAFRDDRIKAAINLDGGVFDNKPTDSQSPVPVLVMHHDSKLGVPGYEVYPHSEFSYEPLKTAGVDPNVVRLMTQGATHVDYTDSSLFNKRQAELVDIVGGGTIDGLRMQNIMNDFVLAFFDQHLDNKGSGIDTALRQRYPEVVDVDLSHIREWAATDPTPIFMSHTHVFIMNRLLAASTEANAEAAKLDGRYVMAFKLQQGEKTHWWQTIFDPAVGMRFSLQPPETTPDLTLEGDYVEYIQFMKRLAAGEATEDQQPVTAVGNQQLMEIIGAAFAAGRGAATIRSEFPDL